MPTCRLAVFCGLTLPSMLLSQADWTNLMPGNGPSTRTFAKMAYDIARGEMVLFGGGLRAPATTYGDTWVWNGGSWVARSPVTVPPARGNPAMAYHLASAQVLMFGGLDSQNGYLDDTWTWDGTDWTQQAPMNQPSPRAGSAMAYDLARARSVLYGGSGSGGALLGDTWEWTGADWMVRSPATAPALLGWHSMSYDLSRDVTLMFGGYIGGNVGSNVTYEWDGNDWTQRTPVNSPPGRYGIALTYDLARGVHVLFGGWDSSVATRNDTWEWDGTNWTLRQPTAMPGPRGYPAAAYDFASGKTLVFGGESTTFIALGDTWSYSSASLASFASYGAACAGGLGLVDLVATSGLPWTGDPMAVEFRNLQAASVTFLVFGFQRAMIDLGPVGIPGCTQWLSAAGNILLGQTGTTATWIWTIPNDPALAGVMFQLQGAALNAGGSNALGVAVSQGLEATIGVR